jgi:hypothetical protein
MKKLFVLLFALCIVPLMAQEYILDPYFSNIQMQITYSKGMDNGAQFGLAAPLYNQNYYMSFYLVGNPGIRFDYLVLNETMLGFSVMDNKDEFYVLMHCGGKIKQNIFLIADNRFFGPQKGISLKLMFII